MRRLKVMNLYINNNYQDWIYIAAVIVAFFVFLVWNLKKQKTSARDRKRTFKQRLQDKRNNET